ncbi:MAG: inorganic pyrophosphatase [Leptospiraceae bacterium]|nr:inorganic pyrophosphatase [Leptospiraceae bacterium]MCK6381085.1 inorganic pyrophosphatase [Leptospiraceae bacterium]NUM42996.1 inorganic pyrophosphatase [Leptospiraceae bacterium]
MNRIEYVLHPWHGLSFGKGSPDILDVFIEITPADTVKYEIDKASGYIRLDRPQKYSNRTPCLYGFIPQTYCGDKIANLCMSRTGKKGIRGDGDPLDICVLTSSPITQGNIILSVIPIGGFRMIDKKEADDKIIAVLKDDDIFGSMKNISDCPKALVDKLKHYFLTYKLSPEDEKKEPIVEIAEIYEQREAKEVIVTSMDDYTEKFVKNR